MAGYILEVDDLTKTYGRFPALNGLTMRVPEGSIYKNNGEIIARQD